jgi:hypothetical protein
MCHFGPGLVFQGFPNQAWTSVEDMGLPIPAYGVRGYL